MQRIVFFGSSTEFSPAVLEKLAPFCVAVVTTEDKPVGRHLVMTPNPVKVLALKIGLPVYDKIKDFLMTTNDYSMTIGLVAAYGKIIPQNVLDNFGGQMYNIHPSILPKYRGPSPLQQQILDDVVDTGVTIIRMDDKMDHGSIIGVVHDTILPSDTTISLGNRLFALGADAILNSQFSIFNQIPIPQNHNEATYTHKLTKQDGFVNYLEIENCKLKISRMQRAFYPWPGVWTIDSFGKRIILSKNEK